MASTFNLSAIDTLKLNVVSYFLGPTNPMCMVLNGTDEINGTAAETNNGTVPTSLTERDGIFTTVVFRPCGVLKTPFGSQINTTDNRTTIQFIKDGQFAVHEVDHHDVVARVVPDGNQFWNINGTSATRNTSVSIHADLPPNNQASQAVDLAITIANGSSPGTLVAALLPYTKDASQVFELLDAFAPVGNLSI